LNPPELVVSVPEVVSGFPDRLVAKDAAATATLRGRTLTALYNQRGKPEGAWVATAYGWPATISTDDVLTRLLVLNRERAAAGQAAVPPQPSVDAAFGDDSGP
jgi:hypothetical protein